MSAHLIVRVYQILSNEMLDFRVCVSQKHITLTQPHHKISNSVSTRIFQTFSLYKNEYSFYDSKLGSELLIICL